MRASKQVAFHQSSELDRKFNELLVELIKKNKPFRNFFEESAGNIDSFVGHAESLTSGVGDAIKVREFLQAVYQFEKPFDAMSSEEYDAFIEPVNSIIKKVDTAGEISTVLKHATDVDLIEGTYRGDAVELVFDVLDLVKLPGGDKILAFGPGYLKAGYEGSKREIRQAAIDTFSRYLDGIEFNCSCGDVGTAEDFVVAYHRTVLKTPLF